jgi:hypothetical protein
MYSVLKKEGILYLVGKLKEGTHENWQGLHLHDIFPENGQLIHYNKMGQRTNLTKNFKMKCIYQLKEGNKLGDWYTIVHKKI